MAKEKLPATKLWPSSYQHYFEICHLMDLYTHYVQAYTKKYKYARVAGSNYRSHYAWNNFFKAHAYLTELGCPPEVYLEGLFTKYIPSPGKEYPMPNMIKYYSFLVMEYLKSAKVSYGNFYQIPDSIEDEMAKQLGRGLINYFRIKHLIADYDGDDLEEYVITMFPGSFDDYFIVSNPTVFIKAVEDKEYLPSIFKSRADDLKCKISTFTYDFNFRSYEKLNELKNRLIQAINTHLAESNAGLEESLSDIQRELERIKYNI